MMHRKNRRMAVKKPPREMVFRFIAGFLPE
jgi:hypothetical protein